METKKHPQKKNSNTYTHNTKTDPQKKPQKTPKDKDQQNVKHADKKINTQEPKSKEIFIKAF